MFNNIINNLDHITNDLTIQTVKTNRDIIFKSSNSLKSVYVVHQNIRSLRRNFNLLISHIDAFENLPDMIFVSEIWIFSCEIDDYKLQNYNFYANSNDSYCAGGVGVFVRDMYECEVKRCSLPSADIIKISCSICNEMFDFICVYRLQSLSIQVFIEEFSTYLRNVRAGNLILLGDFNIDLLDSNSVVDSYHVMLSEHGLVSFVNEPTRPTSGTCLDHVFGRFLKMFHNPSAAIVFDLQITDHCMTGIVFSSLRSKEQVRHVPERITAKIDFRKLNNNLLFADWVEVYVEENPSRAYDLFLKSLTNFISNSSYFVVKKRSEIRLKPWISHSLLKTIRLKHKLRTKLWHHPHNSNLRNRFKKICQHVKKEVRLSRDCYYQNKLRSSQGNLKEEWKIINSMVNRKVRDQSNVISIHGENVDISDPGEIANEFNDYFITVGRNSFPAELSLPCDCCTSYRFTNNAFSTNSFYFEPISGVELLKEIRSLKNSYSCGNDGISNFILKHIAYNIADILAHIFNLSVNFGIFPEQLKCANVIPLFKKGNKKEKSNYRPISLLPSISKIFEKVIKNRILVYLRSINFFSSLQFGFRAGLSTEDALLDFCTIIQKGLDSKKSCAALFVDITKAFDMVNHSILLQKLYNAGFRGFFYSWLESYLKNRTQKVKINNVLSGSKAINLGVPQGSVLGPILFLIYVNSIFEQPFMGKVKAFADDLAIAYDSTSPLNLCCEINHDVHLLRTWFANHKLIVSQKTKLLFFSLGTKVLTDVDVMFHAPDCTRHILCNINCLGHGSEFFFNSNLTCNANCFKIDTVEHFKYLGVTIDQHLSWTEHLANLKQYLLSSIRCFYRLRKFCTNNTLKTIYYGIFHSKLEYGICCWGGAYLSKLQQLIVLQKCALRRISNSARLAHTMELFRLTKILPVRHLFYYKVLKIFFLRGGYLQSPIYDAYNLRSSSRSVVVQPAFRTTHFRNSYTIVSCQLFDRLPANIRNIRTLSAFLKSVKSWLFEFNINEIEVLLRYVV